MKKYTLLLAALFILAACGNNSVSTEARRLGNDDAPILLEEFSDPQCPACAFIGPQVEELVRENPELVRLEYYHFPLSYHEHAFLATQAAECAGDQGKFFDYMGGLFRNSNSINNDFLYNLANSMDLDRDAFDHCLETEKYRPKILAHLAEGKRRGLPGTPTLYVNGQMVRWSDPETFKAYLKSLLN